MSERHRDPSLDVLLDLDGQVLVVDPKGGYWVRFVVRRVDPSPEQPHGLDYSLTLHAPDGSRLVGFDNAHPVRQSAGPAGKSRRARDHKHRLGTVRPYRFTGPASLLEGFWREVGQRSQRERGSLMKVLRIGIASYEEMKARTIAIARGKYRPAPNEPKVWFTSAESFAKVLSDKNRALLHVIAESSPGSLAELAQRTGRRKSNLSRTLKTMERYGFVVLRRGVRGSVIPRVPYGAISLVMSLTA